MNLPNILTMSRIVMIPVFVVIFYLPMQWSYLVSAIIFALAGLTDWLDGYLARKLNQSTPFGAFLDPVADKLMVAVALAVLIEEYSAVLLTIPATVIIGREIV
ncbi:MAG: CDP-diacylglycerol--glycerol-3-phosphate 3-phosphatidyltransferase, partial [Pseudomonadota bacterium]|nr:CDP-diacylglycerol--glycerol-3-phosphate 3-phosphatidyltransferase [Pseudomonadota bacterium]